MTSLLNVEIPDALSAATCHQSFRMRHGANRKTDGHVFGEKWQTLIHVSISPAPSYLK